MKIKNLFFVSVLALFSLFSCSRYITIKETKYEFANNTINEKMSSDSHIDSMIAPQKKLLDSLMNIVIAYNPEELVKDKPNGSLNNFCADMMLNIGRTYDTTAHICIINYGGIRLSALPKGNITKGKIYELLPFDNLIVLQKIKGNVLQEVLDYVASQGGWPIAGIQFEIKNQKANHVLVDHQELDKDRIYTLVTSDYLANGGDNLAMLKTIPQIKTNLIMREAFINELKKMSEIKVNDIKRIQHVD